jgi:hypothetical protein
MKRFKHMKNILLILSAAAVFGTIRGRRLSVVRYKVYTRKITGKIRLALLSDLHSFNHGHFGKPQEKLTRFIDAAKPDLIMMAGDIADHVIPHDNTKILLRKLGGYPVFYVTGNHEYKSGEICEIKRFFRELGADVLEGVSRKITVGNNKINVCGVDDAIIGMKRFKEQLRHCHWQTDKKLFTIFLTHRPEKIDLYNKLKFDLILTGHCHGGQVRIPRITNGFYAINQGFNPKYVGGLYNIDERGRQNMVVSRGLSKSTRGFPRVFNRPELVIIDVCGE